VTIVGEIVYIVGWIFVFLLLFRIVMDYVQVFSRDYVPRGAMLIAVEIAYTITDPPLKLVRRVIPPLRLGSVTLDLGLLVLLLFVQVVVIGIIAPAL
jgi:YggT family protein